MCMGTGGRRSIFYLDFYKEIGSIRNFNAFEIRKRSDDFEQ